MSEAKIAPAPETTKNIPEEKKASIVDTVFDIGVSWVNVGLKMGQMALENSAKTLQETAKTLASVSAELGKKA